MQFGILGPLEVRSATGSPVAVAGPRPRTLLVLLLLNPNRTVTVDALIAGQYGDDPPAGAANAVQAHVSRLRRSLPAALIEFDGAGYRVAVDPDEVDAHRFARLTGDGHRLLAAGQHARATAVLREALALWRGPALADLPHGTAQATRLEELRLAATEDLIDASLAGPDGFPVAELRTLVAAHPLRERLRGQLMRALHATGRQAEALAEFASARRHLADELGADPSPELADTHLAILRGTAGPVRQAVPAQLTSFVGRDAELARLASLREHRLVTIVGPGGTGKTRLAIEAAGDACLADLCFVDLSPVTDGELVPHAVLSALGLRESGLHPSATDPVRRLIAALDGPLLLVLDNCEQVIAAAAGLVRALLAGCPALRVLATSREPLGLTGETLLPLAPLDGAAPVRLFADRAAAVRPDFTVTPAVSEICAALDGLPLAIELAAARLRQFTVAQLAARLASDGPFRLLSRGDRTAAARHRTLHAVVAWSWDLLSPAEQAVARRFSVFTGGAPPDAAEAVCDGADETLADLVDRSFLETSGGRYRMLETIRLFCAEQLASSGESDSVRRKHAAYYLMLAQEADPHLRRAAQLDWLTKLSVEHDNLMAALRWAVRADRAVAFRLVAALTAYWWLSGRRSQAGAAAAELLAGRREEGLDEEYVACVVHAVPRASPSQWARAGSLLRTPGRVLRYPFVAAVFGMTAGPLGPSGETSQMLGTDPWNLALGRLSIGLLRLLGGEPTRGERELRDVLEAFRGLGERWGMAQALDWLAEVAGWRGEWRRAHELWAESLALYERFGALEECVDVRCRRADCLLRQGDLNAAGADYRQAADLAAKAGQPAMPPAVRVGLAEIARLRGDHATAANLLDEALRATQSATAPSAAAPTEAPPTASGSEPGKQQPDAKPTTAPNAKPTTPPNTKPTTAPNTPPSTEPSTTPSAPDPEPGGQQQPDTEPDTAPNAKPSTSFGTASGAGAGEQPGDFGAESAKSRILTALGRLAEAAGKRAEAHRWHREALAVASTSPLSSELASAVEGMAGVAESAERAATLLGSAVALRGTTIAGDVDVARVAERATAGAGTAGFAEAYSRAARQTPEQARATIADITS